MWTINLSTHELSRVVWRRLFNEFFSELDTARANLQVIHDRLERDRDAMTYKTGSISVSSGILLYLLARKIKPSVVFEVGTFIGRSASSMLLGMDKNESPDRLFYTCDLSNDFVMDTSHFKTPVKAMPRTGSTEALKQAIAIGRKVDFFHFDGRLQGPDVAMVSELSHDRTAFALDDFEGIEKGVINAIVMKQHPQFTGFCLIEPPTEEMLAPYGITDRCLTALLVSPAVFQLTPQ